MEPATTSALDQLSGVCREIADICGGHYRALVASGIDTSACAEMAGELHTALIESLVGSTERDDE